MPFESDKQRRFMYAKHPGIARRWSEEAKEEGVSPTKHKKRRRLRRKERETAEKELEKGMSDLVTIQKAYMEVSKVATPGMRAGVPALLPKSAYAGKPVTELRAHRQRAGRLAALHIASGDKAGGQQLINRGKRIAWSEGRGSVNSVI